MSIGQTPAVVLVDPKYPHNVGSVVRTAACFGVPQVWYTGTRAREQWQHAKRLPREERMPQWTDKVRIIQGRGRFLGEFGPDAVPVCVEVHPSAEDLTYFEHPPNAVYIFGPEDGGLDKGIKSACHRFLVVPSDGPLNLAVTVGVVLAHRRMQLIEDRLIEPVGAYQRVRGLCPGTPHAGHASSDWTCPIEDGARKTAGQA
jgi:tRNA(Leu) C34 or U34 (ribose-2'-O)-methylase TrmL